MLGRRRDGCFAYAGSVALDAVLERHLCGDARVFPDESPWVGPTPDDPPAQVPVVILP